MTIGLIIRNGSNVAKTVTALIVRNGSNVAKTVTEAYDRDTGNVSELFFNPSGSVTLAATVAPGHVSGTSFGTGTATTGVVDVTVTGGAAPFAYVWSLLSYTADVPPTATAPTGASTAFAQTSMDPGGVYTSEWEVTVTDDNGTVAVGTPTVTAIFVDNSA